MNRNQAKELAPIIQAFAEGKPIQYRARNNGTAYWSDVGKDYEEFKPHAFIYRIKPEPKYRPFQNAEECWEEMQKHQSFGWIKSKDDSTLSKFMFIDSLRNDEVSISNVDFNYKAIRVWPHPNTFEKTPIRFPDAKVVLCKPDKIQICFFDKTLLTEPYRIVGKKAFTANQTI